MREHVSSRRERVLLATAGFVLTIVMSRIVTGVLHAKGAGSDGGIIVGGVHLHHFVFGIAIVLGTSMSWLLLGGIDDQRLRWFRITAVAYGIGTGLILDEFALWLNLEDVYWQHRGRQTSKRSPRSRPSCCSLCSYGHTATPCGSPGDPSNDRGRRRDQNT